MTLHKWVWITLCLFLSSFALHAQSADAPFPITTGSLEGNINDVFFTTFYSFEVVTDDIVTLTLSATSGDLDPYMNLYASNGDILLFNDDIEEQSTRDSQITFTADSDETLIVEATRFDGADGLTSGTYRLTLEIEGISQAPTEVDPLSLPPPFGVDFLQIEYESLGVTGQLDGALTENYFAFQGRQGDFVRVVVSVTDGDLRPIVSILNSESTLISTSQNQENETIALGTVPENGWYLIEVRQESGQGNFNLFATQLAQSVLNPNQPVSGVLTESVPTLSYVFNGTINDTILASVELLDDANGTVIQPQISLLNIDQEIIASALDSESDRASVLTDLPRSGPYIVQVSTSGTRAGGNIVVELLQSAFGVDKLNIRDIRYNDSYKGIITDGIDLQYYRFVGKVGELVTIDMRADDPMALDPFLILLDSNLNELAFNDTVGNSANARITQFLLPENGEYYIIASRAGLEDGTTQGRYTLSMTVGQIELQTGNFMASLNWEGDADLNLFVREPSGRVISWSNPEVNSGGELQIDSNTNCETPTAQPVEHIYFPNTVQLPTGDYTVWVWYQNVCSMDAPVPFTLTISTYNQEVIRVTSTPENPITISPNQRFEVVLRVNPSNSILINNGEFNSPTPQQTASQGGDILIRYDETQSDTIRDDIYARFYQFMGEPNDRIVITVETQTGDLDPIVILRTANDENLATNDDLSATNRNSRLEYTLEEAGQYIIAVTRYGLRDGTTTGSYTLSLERQTE